ncbi:hypothetical protein NHP190003_14860 [Helicobacter sp. NHP19-003]|uniref:Periplasmic protein n=1 Tax=Helicobacter gastrocanis TaxID=2849641 RepID=A0ABN6I3S0_9HELI|nr:hypothetical protein [Helicobacter sp. NHP19-003]BCZ18204.1 hypothetical protein NHP190003_14860 [Helicobacter sp. NHP19-003]
MRLKALGLVLGAFLGLGLPLFGATSKPMGVMAFREVLAVHFMRSAIVSHNLALQGDRSTLFTGAICESMDAPYKCYVLRTLVLSHFEKAAHAYRGKRIVLEGDARKPFIVAMKEALQDFMRDFLGE